MTITSYPTRNEYTATAGQTIFNYTFKIFASTDLKVYVTPVGSIANDLTDEVSGFSVTGVDDEDGGTVTLSTAANVGDLVTIVSNIPSDRATDYINNGDFVPDTVNADFDRVVSLAKQIEDHANRSVLFQEAQQGLKPFDLPNPVSGNLLAWKSTLDGLENVAFDSSDVVINIPILLLSDYANLAAAIAAIGSTTVELWIDSNETLSASATTHLNTTIRPINGYALSDDANNADLTINGQFIASPTQQVFNWGNGSGRVTFGAYSTKTVYPEWWGIDGADDEVEIELALGSLTSGGNVFLTGDNYSTGDTIYMLSNCWLHGIPMLTTIKLKNSGNAHIIDITDKDHVVLSDVILDGNKDNNASSTHGIRLDGDVSDITIKDIQIKECVHYGIGAQVDDAQRVYIQRIYIHNVGGDGIDFKNIDSDSQDIFIDNIVVQYHGENGALSDQAGLDIRGFALISNIAVTKYGSGSGLIGIRLRAGETGVGNGLGAHRSTLSNFQLRASVTTNTFGLVINCRETAVSTGVITGCGVGLKAAARANNISNISTFSCDVYGFHVVDYDGSNPADQNLLTGCKARDCGIGFQIEGDENVVSGFNADHNTTGIVIAAGATDNSIGGGSVSDNTTDVSDSGTSTHIFNVLGWITKHTGAGTIVSGATSVTISHTLSVTPITGDFSVMPAEAGVNPVGLVYISSITSTQFTVNVENDPGSNWSFGWKVNTETY